MFFSSGSAGCTEVLASTDEDDGELEKWLGDDWNLCGDEAGEGEETGDRRRGGANPVEAAGEEEDDMRHCIAANGQRDVRRKMWRFAKTYARSVVRTPLEPTGARRNAHEISNILLRACMNCVRWQDLLLPPSGSSTSGVEWWHVIASSAYSVHACVLYSRACMYMLMHTHGFATEE